MKSGGLCVMSLKPSSMSNEVSKRKQWAFKVRCDDAVKHAGLSQRKFYSKSGISRQMWYAYSWGIIPFPSHLKIKLCDMFGKPFIDLFMMEAEVKKDGD